MAISTKSQEVLNRFQWLRLEIGWDIPCSNIGTIYVGVTTTRGLQSKNNSSKLLLFCYGMALKHEIWHDSYLRSVIYICFKKKF